MKLERGEPPGERQARCTRTASFRSSSATSPATPPRWSSRSAAFRARSFVAVAETLCRNSGRERTSAICYAVGWTQHTHGVQNIRSRLDHPAAARQHRASRRRDPRAARPREHPGLDRHPDAVRHPARATSRCPTRTVGTRPRQVRRAERARHGRLGLAEELHGELLKAWWGEAATPENNFAFAYLPRIDGDHSHYPMMLRMIDGGTKGFIVSGRTRPSARRTPRCIGARWPTSSGWSCATSNEIETAAFWYDSPDIESGEMRPEQIGTEVFFLPAAAHTEKDGTFTNTQRLLQWHSKAVEPPGDCRSDLWFTTSDSAYATKLAELAGPQGPPDPGSHLGLPHAGPARRAGRRGDHAGDRRPHADGTFISDLPRAGRRRFDRVRVVDPRRPLRRRREQGSAQEARWRAELDRRGVGLGVARPSRILYNRASADPDGRPWSQRKRYVWWDEQEGRWMASATSPTSSATSRPATSASGRQGHGGNQRQRAVHPSPRRPRLAVRSHRARRRPAANPLRATRVAGVERALHAAARTPRCRPSRAARIPTTPPPATRAPRCSRSCSRPIA